MDEITYQFPNFQRHNHWSLKMDINNFIPHFTRYVITYPCWDLSESILVKGASKGRIKIGWFTKYSSVTIMFKDNLALNPSNCELWIMYKMVGVKWWYTCHHQGSFCVCTQPMRDDITLQLCLSLAGCIHKIIPAPYIGTSRYNQDPQASCSWIYIDPILIILCKTVVSTVMYIMLTLEIPRSCTKLSLCGY